VNDIRLGFLLSLFGHAVLLTLLVLFVRGAPPLPLPQATSEIAVSLAPSLPQPEAPPAPPQPRPPPPKPPVAAVVPPPQPRPPPEVPAPTTEAPPPLPLEKPVAPPLRPVVRRFQRPAPSPPPVAAPQTAAARLPAPSSPPAAISPSYRMLLGEWLESHKRYPESAREHGEEGRAVLQFVVDRDGRVVDFAVVTSSGYPDIDAAVNRMMQGARLPPFPAEMPQSSIKVWVAIDFRLAR
jgi:protein TonB